MNTLSDNVTTLHLCPKCDNMMIHNNSQDQDTIQLECISCSHIDTSVTTVKQQIIHETVSNMHFYAVPSVVTCHDRSLSSTSVIKCPNPQCSSHLPAMWVEKFPKIMLTNYAHNDRNMYAICCTCHTVWT